MKVVIVIPAFNEEKILKSNIRTVVNFCQDNLLVDWQIVVSDNGSIDQTGAIAKELADEYQAVGYVYTDRPGKGAAIRTGWRSVLADVYCFMDADLATDLTALPKLIEAIQQGANCALGSRFEPGARSKRSPLRWIFSYGYRWAAKLILQTKIKDLPCGFKAIDSRVFAEVVPRIKNQSWFFDSELMVLAEKSGFKAVEIPVVWEDVRPVGDNSRVKTLSLSRAYLKELFALRRRLKI